MEIGIDIEENSRFKNFSDDKLTRMFTQNEIEYAKKFVNFENHLCAFWCAKEAVIKAFSNKKIEFTQIEISHNEDGKPFIVKNETIKMFLKQSNFTDIKISISHAKDYSTAVCLLY